MSKKDWDILEFANKATQIIEKNFKAALVVFLVIVAGGSAYVLKKNADASSEMEAFNSLFSVTKAYQEKKADFELAKTPVDPKAPKKKDEKTPAKATGDMAKDYGEIVTQLEGFLNSQKGTNASGEAALMLSEIYEEYKQPEKGAEIVSKALSGWSKKGLLFQVLNLRAGDLWASSNNCDKAVSFWQKIATDDSFVSQQAQLKLGICYQELGRVEEAKTWFTKVKKATPNSTEGFNAGRYLRYIQFKNKLKPSNEKAVKAESNDTKS